MIHQEPQFAPQPMPHERYEELCALATAGALLPQEHEALLAHLDQCAECSQIFAEYEALATEGVPSLAAEFGRSGAVGEEPVEIREPGVPEFDTQAALARLMHATEEPAQAAKPGPVPGRPVAPAARPSLPTRAAARVALLKHPAGRNAIAASLLLAVGAGSYWFGIRTATHTPGITAESPYAQQLAAEKAALLQTVQADAQRLAALEQQASADKAEAGKLAAEAKAEQDQLDRLAQLNATLSASQSASASQTAAQAAQLAALTQERDATAARLRDAQASYQTVQDELNNLRDQHRDDMLRMASLETKVTTLTAAAKDQGERAKNDEQFLASDKDIRDLIGARNLYIADIMDVNEDGQSRKPFGRVFYTKTKSLVFYAYDLDQQPGVKRASNFTVWGRTGNSDRNPINLGMLYMDSESNKRWTLRVDDPRQLAQLDAIFVTVEQRPKTGLQPEHPTGKPFLYASLRRDANHP